MPSNPAFLHTLHFHQLASTSQYRIYFGGVHCAEPSVLLALLYSRPPSQSSGLRQHIAGDSTQIAKHGVCDSWSTAVGVAQAQTVARSRWALWQRRTAPLWTCSSWRTNLPPWRPPLCRLLGPRSVSALHGLTLVSVLYGLQQGCRSALENGLQSMVPCWCACCSYKERAGHALEDMQSKGWVSAIIAVLGARSGTLSA